MDKFEKALRKLSEKEKDWVKEIVARIVSNDWAGLNVEKLGGYEDTFRVRKGDIRIIFRRDHDGRFFILKVARKSEKTYHGF